MSAKECLTQPHRNILNHGGIKVVFCDEDDKNAGPNPMVMVMFLTIVE
jgi:hypothetical protein